MGHTVIYSIYSIKAKKKGPLRPFDS